jgi:hypothetical protein
MTTTDTNTDRSAEPATDDEVLAPPRAETWGAGLGPVGAFFAAIFDITFRPARFFSRLNPYGGVLGPLAFALVVSWVGKAIEFLWKSTLSGALSRAIDPAWRLMGDLANVDHPGGDQVMFQVRDRLAHWFWGAGSVILDPFFTLAAVLFTAFFVYLGSRILVSPGRERAPSEIRFETALRLVCYGKAPLILSAVPLAGPALGTLLSSVATVIGARELYRVGWGRAIGVALFPQLLLLGLVMTAFLAMGLVLLQLFATVLGS